MENEKSELRRILDLFENAKFTVTYYLQKDDPTVFQLGIESYNEKEPASAGTVVSLVENNKYRLIDYKTSAGVAGHTETISITIQKDENAN